MDPSSWIAVYAAIVATGALALEIRRWFETGPRIVVDALPDMTLIGAERDKDERDLLIVRVANRGDISTTITHMIVVEYPNWLARIRDQQSKSFVIPNPQSSGPSIIPANLAPGGLWQGIARSRPDVTGDIRTGNFWAGVITSGRNRPFLARIKCVKPDTTKDSVKL